MSWLSNLAFWRDDTPEIDHVDGYEVEGCFVPNDVEPDLAPISDTASEIGQLGGFTQPESGPR